MTTSPSGTNSPINGYEVSVRTGAALGSDTVQVMSGPGAGISQGVGSERDYIGLFSVTGNKIFINETMGADSIEIHHYTGSQMIFDPDGSIFVIPMSRKGFGINSPRGDGLISAKNHLVFKGDGKVTLESGGDLEINVAKNFYLNVEGDMISRVKGSMNSSIDGIVVEEFSSDVATTIAGTLRNTVAGNLWDQVSGNIMSDAGGTYTQRIAGNTSIETQSNLSLKSKSKLSLESKDELRLEAVKKISIDGQMELDLVSGGNAKLSSKGTIIITSDGTNTLSSAATTIISGPSITLRGIATSTNSPIPGGAGPYSAIPTSTPETANTSPSVPIVASANTVIDAVTSARRYPEIPLNLNREPASSLSVLQNEQTTINPRALAEVAASFGGGQQTMDTPFGEVPPSEFSDTPSSSRVARRTTFSAPTSLLNSQERLSRNITVGMFPGISQIPENFRGLSKREIVDNIQNLCFNILDPLWEQFGSRITFTSLGGWRQDSNNHNTGKAADVRASNRTDYALSAEIATFARDNLPYSKILLEKNNYNTIHAHLESANPGGRARGTILTCSTPSCSVSTPGIQLSFATAALTGRSNA